MQVVRSLHLVYYGNGLVKWAKDILLDLPYLVTLGNQFQMESIKWVLVIVGSSQPHHL